MNNNQHRRLTLTFAAAVGGLFAAALLPMTVAAAAAAEYVYGPDVGAGTYGDAMAGAVEKTSILGGLITADKLTSTGWDSLVPGALPPGATIDLVQLPFGFGNELIDVNGLTDIVITPYGDFTL